MALKTNYTLPPEQKIPVGHIFASGTSPVGGVAGYLPCNGSEVNVADYPELYAAIGNTFGASSNPGVKFKLPDLKGKSPIGSGANAEGYNYAVGQSFGSTIKTLTPQQIPSHSHLISDPGHTHQAALYQSNGYNNPGNFFSGNNPSGGSGTAVTGNSYTGINTTQAYGNGDPINILNPVTCIYFYIKHT